MGNDISKILTGLYIGNLKGASDSTELLTHGITHILAIYEEAKPIVQGIEYMCLPISDSLTIDIVRHIPQTNDFIHKARLSGGSVLVHCHAGISRSVTIVVAYLMTVTNVGWRDALMAVKSIRPYANPNFNFQQQLKIFKNFGLAQERKRLLKSCPYDPRLLNDRCEVLCLAESYRRTHYCRDSDSDSEDLSNLTAFIRSHMQRDADPAEDAIIRYSVDSTNEAKPLYDADPVYDFKRLQRADLVYDSCLQHGVDSICDSKPLKSADPVYYFNPLQRADSVFNCSPQHGVDSNCDSQPLNDTDPVCDCNPLQGADSVSDAIPRHSVDSSCDVKPLNDADPVYDASPQRDDQVYDSSSQHGDQVYDSSPQKDFDSTCDAISRYDVVSIYDSNPIQGHGPVDDANPDNGTDPVYDVSQQHGDDSISEDNPMYDTDLVYNDIPLRNVCSTHHASSLENVVPDYDARPQQNVDQFYDTSPLQGVYSSFEASPLQGVTSVIDCCSAMTSFKNGLPVKALSSALEISGKRIFAPSDELMEAKFLASHLWPASEPANNCTILRPPVDPDCMLEDDLASEDVEWRQMEENLYIGNQRNSERRQSNAKLSLAGRRCQAASFYPQMRNINMSRRKDSIVSWTSQSDSTLLRSESYMDFQSPVSSKDFANTQRISLCLEDPRKDGERYKIELLSRAPRNLNNIQPNVISTGDSSLMKSAGVSKVNSMLRRCVTNKELKGNTCNGKDRSSRIENNYVTLKPDLGVIMRRMSPRRRSSPLPAENGKAIDALFSENWRRLVRNELQKNKALSETDSPRVGEVTYATSKKYALKLSKDLLNRSLSNRNSLNSNKFDKGLDKKSNDSRGSYNEESDADECTEKSLRGHISTSLPLMHGKQTDSRDVGDSEGLSEKGHKKSAVNGRAVLEMLQRANNREEKMKMKTVEGGRERNGTGMALDGMKKCQEGKGKLLKGKENDSYSQERLNEIALSVSLTSVVEKNIRQVDEDYRERVRKDPKIRENMQSAVASRRENVRNTNAGYQMGQVISKQSCLKSPVSSKPPVHNISEATKQKDIHRSDSSRQKPFKNFVNCKYKNSQNTHNSADENLEPVSSPKLANKLSCDTDCEHPKDSLKSKCEGKQSCPAAGLRGMEQSCGSKHQSKRSSLAGEAETVLRKFRQNSLLSKHENMQSSASSSKYRIAKTSSKLKLEFSPNSATSRSDNTGNLTACNRRNLSQSSAHANIRLVSPNRQSIRQNSSKSRPKFMCSRSQVKKESLKDFSSCLKRDEESKQTLKNETKRTTDKLCSPTVSCSRPASGSSSSSRRVKEEAWQGGVTFEDELLPHWNENGKLSSEILRLIGKHYLQTHTRGWSDFTEQASD